MLVSFFNDYRWSNEEVLKFSSLCFHKTFQRKANKTKEAMAFTTSIYLCSTTKLYLCNCFESL